MEKEGLHWVMSFKINGKISGVETIAQGSGIRCLGRLQRAYGIGNWKKKKGFATVVINRVGLD